MQAANDNQQQQSPVITELVRLGYVKASDGEVLHTVLRSIWGDRILVRAIGAQL